MRFDGEIDRRLRNWTTWRLAQLAGGRLGAASLAERVDCSGWDAPTVIPTNDAEAEETQCYVVRLAGPLRYAVEAWYLHPGSVATRCAKVNASETEVRKRVALAQRQIGQWIQDRREAADRERQRLDVLRVSARTASGLLRSVGNR